MKAISLIFESFITGFRAGGNASDEATESLPPELAVARKYAIAMKEIESRKQDGQSNH